MRPAGVCIPGRATGAQQREEAAMKITRWRRRNAAPVRDGYMTPAEHRQEAVRLAWVIDDVLQSRAKRSLSDLIAVARLHLDLAQEAGGEECER